MQEHISDNDFLSDVYIQARERYKPKDIRVLIIAEAPPCALDRFFYFEDVKKQDSLFLEVMGIIYPELKQRYLNSGRATELKQDLLEHFRSDGFWMIDLYELPTSIAEPPISEQTDLLLKKLSKLIAKDVPVILIKSNVYDACYSVLSEHGYNVINERLPFPGSGQQKVFREKFRNALAASE